ncbi:MAG: hypothetical protein ACP5UM_06375 [Anaerolineae bacterium]
MEEEAVVVCYSGHRYAEEPQRFTVGGREHQVARVLRAWQEPEGPAFLVEDEEGTRWRLRYEEGRGLWFCRPVRRRGV